MKLWTIPRAWEGETCAVLGSGPSMSTAVAEQIRGRCRAIAVNNQGVATVDAKGKQRPALAPWADVLYAADRLWWQNNREQAEKFAGIKATVLPNGHRDMVVHVSDARVLGNGGAQGFDDRPDHVRTGWNSGYQAVHMAAHFGVKRILLCGFDMHAKQGEHWHGDHRWRKGHESRYSLFVNAFTAVAPEYSKRGIEVLNCTPGSALKCFPMADLEEALDALFDVRETAPHSAGACSPGTGGNGTQAYRGIAKEEAQAMT